MKDMCGLFVMRGQVPRRIGPSADEDRRPRRPPPHVAGYRDGHPAKAGCYIGPSLLRSIGPSPDDDRAGFFIARLTGLAAFFLLPALGHGESAEVELFSDDFNADTSAEWTVTTNAPSPYDNPAFGDWEVVFNYDYSADGIPSAPNSPDGETRGLRFSVNHGSAETYALNALPNGQHFSGDYVLKFDLWMNYPGPLDTGGSGSTEFAGFGVGTAGGNVQLFGSPGEEGAWFGVNGEGGNGWDYRAYKGGDQQDPSSGQYGAGTSSSARNTSHSYYHQTFPGGEAAPSLQQSQYPSQTGSTDPGTIGFGWREVEVAKIGTTVTWHIDGLLIAALNQISGSGSFQTEGNIVLGYLDHNTSISHPEVTYGLFDNVRVYELPPQPIPGNTVLVAHSDPFPHEYGDVGGEANIAATGVFYSGTDNGVGIFDVSDPSNPVLRSDYNPSPTWRTRFQDVHVRDGIGYFGSWNRDGIHIVDLSDPSNPVKISQIDSSIGGHDKVHTLFLHGDYLYEADHETNWVKVFDISSPSAPSFVRNIVTTDPERVHQITVRNNRLFTSGWGGHTDIYDVSQIGSGLAPHLGTIESGSNSHSSWPTGDGNVLVSCREISGGDVRFYDITDPADPKLMVRMTPETIGIDAAIPHNPVIMDDLLFVSWYQNGVQIFDISNPALPVRVGYYDTFPGSSSATFAGNWGVYPFLGLDRVLLSDMSNGLFVVDASAVLTATDNYPPLIVKAPESLERAEGSDVVFSVVATGSGPLTYQWYRNGATLDGATESELTLTAVELGDGGDYDVRVENDAGEISTQAATLSVIAGDDATPPQINSQPSDLVAEQGQIVAFSVTASGTEQLRYQWMFEGGDIPGAEDSSLSVGPVMNADAGVYSVRVWNGAGEVESDSAVLEVDDVGFIYDLRISMGGNGAVVSWKTRDPATGVLEYEPGQAHHDTSQSAEIKPMHAEFDHTAPSSSRLATEHAVYLGGLESETDYSFRILADTESSLHESDEFLFKTEPPEKAPVDGVPPQWWTEHFFEEPASGETDVDGDGWTVWAEYLSGTSPVDPASRPAISIAGEGGNLFVEYWPITLGRTYALQGVEDPGGEWAAVTASIETTGDGTRIFDVSASPAESGFFRVEIRLDQN